MRAGFGGLWCALLLASIVCGSGASRAQLPDTTASDTLRRVVPMPEITVSTTRSQDRSPIARTVLTREAIVRANVGLDTPMQLATTPGAYAYSDAGNGIGYSYLSIRGFPQRRISVYVNGVPLNDPESHEVYWIDHPDLLASTREVEIQRGVGSALYGAASLGGSVNLETSPFSAEPELTVTTAYGSYDTKRLVLEAGSGPLAGGSGVYARYSRIETLGYRDRSFSRLWSYFFAARHDAGSQTFRVNVYGGPEETHLAYLGIPAEYLRGDVTGDADRDRRFNPLTYPDERDHFFEPHYELLHSWQPRPHVRFSQTLFAFDGKGDYDEQRFGRSLADYRLEPWATIDTTLLPRADYRDADQDSVLDRDALGRAIVERFDLVRRRTVVNRHYGWVPRVRIEHGSGALTLGGELRAHDGRHYGQVVTGSGLPPATEPGHTYYDYHPRTLAGSLFAREEWQALAALRVTGDLAWRHQSYSMRGDAFDGVRFDQSYDFALPRLGLTWTPRGDVTAFASWARAEREPAFRDLYDAEGLGNVPLYRVVDVARGIYQDPLIRPEKVDDWELGAAWRWTLSEAQAGGGATASLSANLFRMGFRDELVYAGQFDTDLGYPILGNAARSVHQGVELAGGVERAIAGGSRVAIDANLSLSDHHFVEYQEVYGTSPGDTIRYDGNAIGFFPAVLANVEARWSWRGLTLGANAQHAGRIFLDATESSAASIEPRTVLGLAAALAFPLGGGARGELGARVFNALDTRYETSGYMDYDSAGNLVPQFVPAAGRNVLAQFRVRFQ